MLWLAGTLFDADFCSWLVPTIDTAFCRLMDEMITLQRGKTFNKLSTLQLGIQLSQIIQTAMDVLTKLCHNNAPIQQGLASSLDVFMLHAYKI